MRKLEPGFPFLADVAACLLIATAFGMAVRTTGDLTWPPRWDFFRELGTIQAVLDGKGHADPLFLGEGRWYNPLVPYLLAAASGWFDLPLPTFVTRVGPYINLLTPVGFYLLFRALLTPWPALVGLAIFLFWVPPSLPPNSSGLYSPWAWPRNVAQGLYFVGAITLYQAAKCKSITWSAISGLMIGLSFLAHTAPALMLASAAVLLTSAEVSRASSWRSAASSGLRLLLIATTAFATTTPYLIPLLMEYKFVVLNRAPMNTVGLSVLAMATGLLSVRSGLAILGAHTLVRRYRQNAARWSAECLILASLLLSCLLWLGFGVLHQLLWRLGFQSLQIVPEYHFHMYLKSFEAALAGVGLVKALEWWLNRRWHPLGFLLACACAVLINGHRYLNSADLRLFRDESIARQHSVALNDFYAWALEHTASEDVFVGDDRYSLFAVGPTGRKVVSIYPFYGNPYVALEPRNRLRLDLYDALNRRDFDQFRQLAEKATLRFVIAADDADECCRLRVELPTELFRVAFERGRLRVYEVVAKGERRPPNAMLH